ncbi:hypothetical protein VNI00_003488 [Paramarasmius palmivorus]|uniref:Uncharacterized protein n=1 Tax=Paramarasmius palmivorus TaxID=297713 RepID=A0AAW0DS11_9AGAR
MTLSTGIAPTLIMVRAKLGQNVESLQEAASIIQFNSQPVQQGLAEMSTMQSQVQVLSVGNCSISESQEEQVGDVNFKETSAIV